MASRVGWNSLKGREESRRIRDFWLEQLNEWGWWCWHLPKWTLGEEVAELKLNGNQVFCVQHVNSEMPIRDDDKQLEIRREAGAGDKHSGPSARKHCLSHGNKCYCLQSKCLSSKWDPWGLDPATQQYFEVPVRKRDTQPRTLRRRHWGRRGDVQEY